MKSNIKKLILTAVLFSGALLRPAAALNRTHYSNNPYYYYMMARINVETGNIEEGIENYRRTIALAKDDLNIQKELLDLYYITGLYGEALDIAATLYTNTPGDRQVAEVYADLLAKNSKIERAIDIFKKLLADYPDDSDIRINIATLYQSMGENRQALKYFIEVIRMDKTNNYARISIGDIYLGMERYAAAEELYNQAVRFGVDMKEICRQIALVNKHLGKTKKAVKYLQKILKQDPEHVKTLLLLAEIYEEDGQFQKAEKLLNKAKELTDAGMGVILRLGMLYGEMEEHSKAIDVLTEATEKYPQDYNSWYFLGLIHRYAENYRKAEVSLLKALSLKEDAQTYFHLGITYDQMGCSDRGVEMFKKCLQLNPDHARAHNYLGYTWAEQEINLDEAEAHIRRALEIEPDNYSYIDSLGWVLFKQKKYEEALEKLKKAAGKIEDSVVYEHLGDVYLKISSKDKALKKYKKALALDPDNSELEEKIREVSGN